MLGFRPLPVPGLITAGSPIPHPGLCCVSRKGQPCPTPCRTLELTVFWLFDGAIKAFDYDVLVFLGELLLPMYSKGGTGCSATFLYDWKSPLSQSFPITSQRTHFFARLPTWSCCCCAVSLVLVWCFIIYSLPRDVHRLFRHFAGLSFHTNFRKYFRYLGILPYLRCNLCEFYFFRHVVSPCRVPYGGAR